MGNEFAHNRLKSEDDLRNKFKPSLRLGVENYRNNLNAILEKYDLLITNKQHSIGTINNRVDQSCAKLKELQNQLRFYEARILKYESMLLSV